MPRTKKDASLKGVVDKILSDIKKREKEEVDIEKVWKKTAGAKAAKHSKPAFLKSKRLVVQVASSSWLYTLTLEKSRLIKKFNTNVKGNKKKINELQFRIGALSK
jgi:predicted nucleic acid-binding Zn ribbon protein